jgi:hypothetical protein
MEDCKKCSALRQIIEGKDKLLVCYRLGKHRGADDALDKIESAERRLAKLEADDA